MAIYAPPPAPFDCVICREPQMTGFWDNFRGASSPIPPLCCHCERLWGKAIGGLGDLNRDRRMIRQVSALAEVITVTAHCIQNGHRHPYAPA